MGQEQRKITEYVVNDKKCLECDDWHSNICCVELTKGDASTVCGRPTLTGTTHHGLCSIRQRRRITKREYETRIAQVMKSYSLSDIN